MTPREKAFQKEYERLNTAQREAVDAIEGPVLVVAGPGTGKTQILTLRIANILLKTQIDPRNILALTFTESGVAAMRARLFEIIGSPAYRVPIHTFHSFCNEIIRDFPEFFPRIVGSRNITEVEQVQILERVLNESENIQKLRPAGEPAHYVRAIKSALSTLKREGISVSVFSDLIQKERKDFEAIPDLYHATGAHAGKMKGAYKKEEGIIEKNEELAGVYHDYEMILAKDRLYDFDDMIMEASRAAAEEPDLLLMLQEEYQYILVDEHQDTNRAQNSILSLLMNFHENPNLFIVGDMKQAIFRFQGASEANFAHFKKQYPRAREIVLEENYRSTQTILNVAGKLMDATALRARAGHDEKPLSLFALSNPETEMFFVAHDIQKRLDKGISPGSLAVFFRDNRDAQGIARALQKSGIPYTISGEGDVFSDSEIRKLITFFRAIHTYGAEDLFVEALHIDFLSVPPLSVYALLAFAKKNRISVFETLHDTAFLAAQEEESRNAFSRVAKLFGAMATRAKNESFFDFFEYAIRESGFLAKSIELPDSMERIESLAALFESTREFASQRENFTLGDFLAFVDAVEKHGVRIKRRAISSTAHSVQLMTAHKSKGMEFDYVYIIGATDGHWGGRTRREILPLIPRVYSLFSEKLEHDENDDERRLFFVALTRAKKHATITYPRVSESGAPLFLSQFANEIDPASLEIKNTEEFEDEFMKNRAQIFSPSRRDTRDVKTESFVRQLFDEYGLSVTALNNYLSCPWKYFYMNLLRVPKAKEPHQMFGTAVHAALKDFFDTRKTRDVAEEFIAKSFALHLQRQDFSPREFETFLARGTKALEGYVRENAPRLNVLAKNEFEIGRVLLPSGDADDAIPLTGKIDRIEFLGESMEGKISVIDYKTGKPKSRNDILGETRASEGNMFRQLVFYKLLLSLSEDKKYDAVSGVIDFVEPTERGAYRHERFDLDDEMLLPLRDEVLRVAKEIRTLAFWDRFCETPDCEFCSVRKMMRP